MKCFSNVFSQSSLVPLAKIANAPSRSLRLLWAIVTAIMCIGLCICISLVVMQYLKHQTVFQLDYSGRHTVYDQVPGITICPQSQESKRLFLDAMKRLNIITQPMPLPWFSKTVMDQFRMKAIEIQPDLKFGVIVHRLPKGELLWNTSKTALSPIYRMLLNFSVEFQIQPSYLSDSEWLGRTANKDESSTIKPSRIKNKTPLRSFTSAINLHHLKYVEKIYLI
ncbi:unnamed protein product [Schistosoma mattheei]|uniref:Uncharacterized protein n=1 Tax=Schistosoma mattheei TaxID=31246 RepID=A0A183NU88_9TREM|nr:unnamed protein product [Schistosoma mattheei]